MKTKRIIAMMVIICMMLAVSLPVSAYGSLPEGQAVQTSYISADSTEFMVPVESLTEVPEGYIGIYTAEDLDNIRNDLSANYILMNDIDMSEYENWTPICGEHNSTWFYGFGFSGVLDGNGYVIKNFTLTTATINGKYQGLFGLIENGVIENLGFENCSLIVNEVYIEINYMFACGLLAGAVFNSEIQNCYIDGNVNIYDIANSDYTEFLYGSGEFNESICVSAFIGYSASNVIKNIRNYSDITADNIEFSMDIGGIIGRDRGGFCEYDDSDRIGEYYNIYNEGNITLTNIKYKFYDERIFYGHISVGGLFGSVNNGVYIEQAVNSGRINILNTTDSCIYIGGIVGWMRDIHAYRNITHTITDSINYGVISLYESGFVTPTDSRYVFVGGITGSGDCPTTAYISHSSNHGNINLKAINGSDYMVGGISGADVNISCCYNTGNIDCEGGDSYQSYIAGIQGYTSRWAYIDLIYQIDNCYNIGSITLRKNSGGVGGICGKINEDKIEHCYNTGDVSAYVDDDPIIPGRVGRIVAWYSWLLDDTNLEGCYSLDSVKVSFENSTDADMYNDNLAIQCTSDELQNKEALQGFDFDTIWEIGVTEGYPYPTLRENPHIANIIVPENPVKTTFDTTEITLSERETYSFEGLVSTTSENGLKDLQINITNAETGIGIKYFRIENIGSGEFDLSEVPSFTAGTTLTGKDQLDYEQNLELIAGTSWKIQIFATDNDGNSLGDNIIKQINISDPTDITTSVSCQNLEDYAGNYRDFTVTFSSLPDSAYLQFDNQYTPAEWLSDEYCSANVLFNISLNDIRETDGQYVYTTEFRIHSEGLATENYMRKVRIVAYYSGTKLVSDPLSFQVIPIPTEAYGNRIGYQYLQITPTEEITENPIIHTVTNSTGADGSRILSAINYDCHASGVPFFWWETDCGTFYEISDDFTTVGFVPDGSGSVTVYMGDGLGNVASYVLKING